MAVKCVKVPAIQLCRLPGSARALVCSASGGTASQCCLLCQDAQQVP